MTRLILTLALAGGLASAASAQTRNAVVTTDKYCFTLAGGAVTTGTCDPSDNQVLAEYNGRENYFRLMTNGGYCLTAAAKGSQLTDASCQNSRPTTQRWWVNAQTGQFQSQANNLCADVEGGNGDGKRVLMWDCHSGQNQRFAFGVVRSGTSGASTGALQTRPNAFAFGGLNGTAGVVAAGGANVVAAGGGNVVAAGGGNVVAAGGGN